MQYGFYYFNVEYGGFDCPPAGQDSGTIDIRNNIFAVFPACRSGDTRTAVYLLQRSEYQFWRELGFTGMDKYYAHNKSEHRECDRTKQFLFACCQQSGISECRFAVRSAPCLRLHRSDKGGPGPSAMTVNYRGLNLTRQPNMFPTCQTNPVPD